MPDAFRNPVEGKVIPDDMIVVFGWPGKTQFNLSGMNGTYSFELVDD